MPRRPRIYTPECSYHLVARGVRQQDLFLDSRDRRVFLDLLAGHLNGHALQAYCLMGNHLHLLVRCGQVSLSQFMHQLLLSYARYFNRRQGLSGHVFQGRHHSKLCRNEAYLRQVLRYIHRNPVKAGLVADPVDYPWSSLGAYLGRRQRVPVETGLGLSLFGETADQARVSFLEFLRAPVPEAVAEDFRALERWVGTGQGSAPRPSLPLLLRGAERCRGLRAGSLQARGAEPEARLARRLFAQAAVHEFAYRQSEVARLLQRSRTVIHEWLSGKDPGLREFRRCLEDHLPAAGSPVPEHSPDRSGGAPVPATRG